MSISFSINSKSQSNRVKRPASAGEDDSSSKKYVTEFLPVEAPPSELKIQPIAPIPDKRFNDKLKNLYSLPPINQPGVGDGTLVFELDTGSNADPSDGSMIYGLNVRAPSAGGVDGTRARGGETIAEMEMRKFKEDMKMLRDDLGMDQYDDVPVEGFGAALMAGYGWKAGMGIGRNAKEDVNVFELNKKKGRGGLGFTEEAIEKGVKADGIAVEKKSVDNGKDTANGLADRRENKGFGVGKEVRIVKGSKMGMKGKILEVRSGGDLLIIRVTRSNERVKIESTNVAEIGTTEEQECLRKLKELKIKEKDDAIDRKDKASSSKRDPKDRRDRNVRPNWLRNHIRVRVISKDLKKGKLFLKKGVVVDVVGPGVCDISMDESRELVQGVEQNLLETALPKRGGCVLVLYGKHEGVFGSLVERDLEKETGVVQDADTKEFLNVKLEQIAEYIGDPNEMAY